MKFVGFICNPFNRKVLLTLFIYHVLIALVFNWAYPFTVYTNDTPNYFHAAEAGGFCGYRPYGYSAFINFCMFFSKSIYCIVFIQSLLYLLATLLFVFTIEYLSPFKNKKLFYGFIILLSLSGQAFFISNVLLSDSIFLSLSLIWISSLLHLFTDKNNNYPFLLLNFVICFLAAKIRYAGLIYPVIGSLAVLVMYRKHLKTLLTYLVGFLLVFYTVYQQGVSQNKTLYGVNVFSAFGGWAKLNNASVIIPEIKGETKKDEIRLLNAFRDEIKEDARKRNEIGLLDAFLKQYPDSIYAIRNVLTSQLMWKKTYPEKMFLTGYIYPKNKEHGYVPCYVYTGRLYGEYADYLVKTHPGTFINKFYFPNLLRTIYPKDEGLGNIHIMVDKSIQKVCNTGFTFFATRYNIYGAIISVFDEIKYLFLGLLFVFSFVYYIFKKRYKLVTANSRILFLFISCFLILNSLFLAYSIPIFLRFLVVNEFMLITAVFIFLDEFYKLRHSKI
jgi:hypothetical protein